MLRHQLLDPLNTASMWARDLAGTTTDDPTLGPLLNAAIERVATPAMCEAIIEQALRIAGEEALPTQAHRAILFVAGPLHRALTLIVNADAAYRMVQEVTPALEEAITRQTSPPPGSEPPQDIGPSSYPPDASVDKARHRSGVRTPATREPTQAPPSSVPQSVRTTMPYCGEAPRNDLILIVDDDRAFLSGLKRLLRVEGHEVVAVADSSSALSLCRRLEPALVISDLEMPSPNGEELAALIRATMGNKAPSILLLTGRPNPPAAVPGVYRVLTKTVRPHELFAEIEPLLPKR